MKIKNLYSILIYIFIIILIFDLVYSSEEEHDDEIKNFPTFSMSNVKKMIKTGVKCVDIVKYFLKRISAFNSKLNAITNINPNALDEAKLLDEHFVRNKAFIGRLHCIPVLVKDNIDVGRRMPTTGGLNALRYSIPNKDAVMIARLKSKGAIIIAKNNMAEIVITRRLQPMSGDVSEIGGRCNNPYDVNRACGVSSTGTGAGISSALGILGVGTDSDGSIINPSSFNGLYGLRIPRDESNNEGMLPFNLKRDTIGPITKHLDDLVLAYSILIDNSRLYDDFIKGESEHTESEESNEDSADSNEHSKKYLKSKKNQVKASINISKTKHKLGIINNFMDSFTTNGMNYLMDPEVKKIIDNSISSLLKMADKVEVERFSLTNVQVDELFIRINKLNRHECLTNCAIREADLYFNDSSRFGPDAPYNSFKSFASSPLLSNLWAETYRNLENQAKNDMCETSCREYDAIKNDLINYYKSLAKINEVDAILIPSTFQLPPLHNTTRSANSSTSIMTLATSMGYPVLNIPAGFTSTLVSAPNGLPVGISLLGAPEKVLKMFEIAKEYEKQIEVMDKMPHFTPLLDSFFSNYASRSTFKTRFALILILIVKTIEVI